MAQCYVGSIVQQGVGEVVALTLWAVDVYRNQQQRYPRPSAGRCVSWVILSPFILIYQGVHCCTKACNLHLDDSPSKSRDNRMH